ncbi:MAG TPA: PEP-CTERM sorting domain-containing protein [Bryobacteraceae bacterium]|nr:PEP-CTERM sorting domain-containing protein [Bryobacteraceae bacterium]
MEKSVRLMFVCAAALCLAGAAFATPISGVYSSGITVAVGEQDPYWQIYYDAQPMAAYVVEDSGWPGSWAANDANSRWIGPQINYSGLTSAFDPIGDYGFALRFDLTGYNKATADIRFRWSSDNVGSHVFLNGVDLVGVPTIGSQGYGAMSAEFALPGIYLESGMNLLEFKVTNVACPECGDRPNPAAVRVEFTSADAAQVVPEPSVALLTGIGLIGLGVLFRRRRA